MTTLIGWLGVDSRGPSSLYLAADSRFTWTPDVTWDYGRKLFASRSGPVILGYCGDVLFASHGIGQALQLLEAGLLHPEATAPEARVASLAEFLKGSLHTYPSSQQREFSVVYASRIGPDRHPLFFVAEISWSPSVGWSSVSATLPNESAVVIARGSGQRDFVAPYGRWKDGEVGRTSRAVYSAFCDHLANGTDPRTGGPPQLVGLYRTGPAVTFGVIYSGARWLSGARVPDGAVPPDIEWRDELFQRCDGRTMAVKSDAQRHARPKSA
jgi:hypothetical protein